MTAPDPQRAVAEARERMQADIRRILDGDHLDKVGAICDLIAREIARAVTDRVLALLATQDDADAQAPGDDTEGQE